MLLLLQIRPKKLTVDKYKTTNSWKQAVTRTLQLSPAVKWSGFHFICPKTKNSHTEKLTTTFFFKGIYNRLHSHCFHCWVTCPWCNPTTQQHITQHSWHAPRDMIGRLLARALSWRSALDAFKKNCIEQFLICITEVSITSISLTFYHMGVVKLKNKNLRGLKPWVSYNMWIRDSPGTWLACWRSHRWVPDGLPHPQGVPDCYGWSSGLEGYRH